MWYNNYILKQPSLTKQAVFSKEICEDLVAKSIKAGLLKNPLIPLKNEKKST